jgi:hypothetical protein
VYSTLTEATGDPVELFALRPGHPPVQVSNTGDPRTRRHHRVVAYLFATE